MNRPNPDSPSVTELLKVEKLLDRIENEMKKKRAENFYTSPDKYVNYMNKTTELYTLISEEIMASLEINGFSDYVSTFKKLFRGMQQQIQSMLKFTLHHYSFKSMQVREAQLTAKHQPIKTGETNVSPTVSFAMKVQRNLLQNQPDQAQNNHERMSTLGLTSPNFANQDYIKTNNEIVPSLISTDPKTRPQSGVGKNNNRSSCPPDARRTAAGFHLASEQENAFELEAYKKESEKIQIEIDGLLESKNSILKIQPTMLAANLKQILRNLETTKRHHKITMDDDDSDDSEDELEFEKLVQKLMEACSGAQRKLFQKIVSFMEAKRAQEENKSKKDQETMPDPKMLEADKKGTKKQLDQKLKEVALLKEKNEALEQEKLLNTEKYAILSRKHFSCETEKKKAATQISKLEIEIAELKALIEEAKRIQSNIPSARSFNELTPSAARVTRDEHEKLLEQLKEYKAEIETLRSENRVKPSNNNSISTNNNNYANTNNPRQSGNSSARSTSLQRPAKDTPRQVGSLNNTSRKIQEARREDTEEVSPDNSFSRKDINEDIADISDGEAYSSQHDKSEPVTSTKQKSTTSVKGQIQSITIPPGMNAPRIDDTDGRYENNTYDDEAGYTNSKENIEILAEYNSTDAGNTGDGASQNIEGAQSAGAKKVKKQKLNKIKLDSYDDKSKSTEDETQTMRKKLSKEKSPTEKKKETKSNLLKESKEGTPKRAQNKQAGDQSGSPKHNPDDERRVSVKKGSKASVSRRASPSSQEPTVLKNSNTGEDSVEIIEGSPKNVRAKKIIFSTQTTKQTVNDEAGQVYTEAKSPQVRKKKIMKEEDSRVYKESSDIQQREPKSGTVQEKKEKKTRVISSSVDKAVQTDEELYRVHKESMFKRYEDKDILESLNSLNASPQFRSPVSLANKTITKFAREPKEGRDVHSQIMRSISGPRVASMTHLNESMKVRDSLLVSFDIKNKLQSLKYEDGDTSKQVSNRLKERFQTDLIDNSLQKLDDASGDFMSPIYSSVSKGEDTKSRFGLDKAGIERSKHRSTSTFYPGKLGEDNITPHVNYDDTHMTVMYNAMLTKAEQDPKILYVLKNFLKEKGETIDEDNFVPNYDIFVEFMKDFRNSHQRCGENCHHLQRFYARIGYYHMWNKRAPLAMKKPKIVSSNAAIKGKTGGMKLPNIPEKKVLKMAS